MRRVPPITAARSCMFSRPNPPPLLVDLGHLAGVKPQTIVADGQRVALRRAGEANPHILRLGMLPDVGQRLLHDAKNAHFRVMLQTAGEPGHTQAQLGHLIPSLGAATSA